MRVLYAKYAYYFRLTLRSLAGTLTTEQSELTIQEQIAQLYVQIMYTKEAQKVNEQLLTTAQSQYDRGVEMMKQGQMAKADVIQLEAQLSSANYDIVNSKAQIENYKRQLKSVLELDINSDFDIKGDIPSDGPDLQVGIHLPQPAGCHIHFPKTHIGLGKEDRPAQVHLFHPVEIHQRKMLRSQEGKVLEHLVPQGAASGHQHLRGGYTVLPERTKHPPG